MSSKAPRVVVITRETEYRLLLARHGTRAQAAFFLERRGQRIDDVMARHAVMEAALQAVSHAIPLQWRRNRVLRGDLDRFLFEPDDMVVVVGQDGLVANVAKYLDGQPVIGVNPDPAQYDGVLVRHAPAALPDLLRSVVQGSLSLESRTMVEARLGDGQTLLAVNEIFLGAKTHQSARYRLRFQDQQERQSSSGIVAATGTGCTGWVKSIRRERSNGPALPRPCEAKLAFFVREAFPSVVTGVDVTAGIVSPTERLTVVSEMNEGGVIFGDGMEGDHLAFDWGVTATIGVAARQLQLVSE